MPLAQSTPYPIETDTPSLPPPPPSADLPNGFSHLWQAKWASREGLGGRAAEAEERFPFSRSREITKRQIAEARSLAEALYSICQGETGSRLASDLWSRTN